jgi:hypothetical protein
MADTNHGHGTLPVEGDGVHYKGIGWFIVILVGTVAFCQLFVWGLYELTEARVVRSDIPRAPLAAAPAAPKIEDGRLVPGSEAAPAPMLLVDEPAALKKVRTAEDEAMRTYGWVNQGAEIVRLPIGRAKELAIERGFPVRQAVEAAPAAAPAK